MAGHVYGWAEFEIDGASQALTVTSYGISAYVAPEMARESEEILAQTVEVVSQFVVQPR